MEQSEPTLFQRLTAAKSQSKVDRFDWVALEPKLNAYVAKHCQQLQTIAEEQSQSLEQQSLQIQRLEEQVKLLKEVTFNPKSHKRSNIINVCLDSVTDLKQDFEKLKSLNQH